MFAATDLATGHRRLHLPTVDSTNAEARRQADAGADAGLVVTADTQTGGRGRRGRHWVSPPGNLYCSILLRPDWPPAEAALSGFAISLAVAETVAVVLPAGADVRCKWPNDVLVDDRKIAGILIESAASACARLDWLVAGIGVNVASHPQIADRPAVSLRSLGSDATLEDVLPVLVETVAGRVADWRTRGFDAIRDRWLTRAWRLGESVNLVAGGDTVTGAFHGIDTDGGIVLELPGGTRRSLGHGELMASG